MPNDAKARAYAEAAEAVRKALLARENLPFVPAGEDFVSEELAKISAALSGAAKARRES